MLERFLNYIRIDTTSNPDKTDNPSTTGQIELAKMLVKELRDLNVDNIYFDEEHCYVYAVLKGNEKVPKVGFIAHLDTSDGAPGNDIKTQIIPNYDGADVYLNENRILSSSVYPDLKNHVGKTLITTDGNTLLGADDKAGIAEIMKMVEFFTTSEEEHGDIFICFTPDEEIGLGTKHFNTEYFHPDYAYTIDGSSLGEFSYENFNAATAMIEINGNATHTGTAKGTMINAGRIATIINSLLPEEIPENTEGYEGFFHLMKIEGNVSHATMKYLIRDFDKENFEKRKNILTQIAEKLNNKYENCINLNIKDTYHNMYEIINNNPVLISDTLAAISSINVNPLVIATRGGTDGTEISFRGIPCPNLGTGGHNFHSVYEYICLEDMEKVTQLLITIVKNLSKNNRPENAIKKDLTKKD